MWRKKINIYILTSDRGIDTLRGFNTALTSIGIHHNKLQFLVIEVKLSS